MRLGLQVSHFSWPGAPVSIGPTFGRIARDAEAAGMASLWVMDHFFQIRGIGPPELEMLEAYTTLGFAAAQTSRIELGALVTGVTYRHPGILAKTVTTLDVLSGGRAWLGIGAAWNEEEHRGLGVPFPPVAERFERLDETLRIVRQMFAGDDGPFHGRHYTLERTLNSPQPVRRPRPPILVGGMGRRKTLRLVATHADASNFFDVGPDGLRATCEQLRDHCAEVGREYADITKTVLTRISLSDRGGTAPSGERTMSVAEAVDKLGALAEAGIDDAILGMGNQTDPEVYALVAEVVRQVAGLRAEGR
ncbi:LLM class F420-dependent oxidoreductase [Intrasporangium calvum]|uniref:LLM class F420-dependent oxidoreductase n=1 Tax=Intrasporangium calvum TaxID=53358 RepID=UPI000DF615B1|nr:LLM class F420-dependent oxidoreductase [Intrasporangium calvum]AXG12968.1 LLM class F420-dependent oxidoreductase [Intrasporangium calvum]